LCLSTVGCIVVHSFSLVVDGEPLLHRVSSFRSVSKPSTYSMLTSFTIEFTSNNTSISLHRSLHQPLYVDLCFDLSTSIFSSTFFTIMFNNNCVDYVSTMLCRVTSLCRTLHRRPLHRRPLHIVKWSIDFFSTVDLHQVVYRPFLNYLPSS